MGFLNQLVFDFSPPKHFSFDNFIVSDANTELINLFQSELIDNEQFYFVWGVEGAGKSHLLQSLCQSTENSIYIPLKIFAQHGPKILEGLEIVPLVCLDDIECILNDDAWEQALFHFFNTIREAGNRILFSASSAPRELQLNLADLASRLSWGIVYQLHEIEDEDKARAFRLRAKNKGILLNDEIIKYIFLRSSRNMNALFAVLDTLDQLSLAENRKITIPFVKGIMSW